MTELFPFQLSLPLVGEKLAISQDPLPGLAELPPVLIYQGFGDWGFGRCDVLCRNNQELENTITNTLLVMHNHCGGYY